MKYSFNIQANDSKQDYTEKLVLGAFNNEAGTHIALKLLAYLMFKGEAYEWFCWD